MTATADFDKFDRLRPQRLEPLKAFRAFRRLVRNKEDTAQVFEIMRALSGRSIGRGYNRMLKTMEGGRQAFLREELAHKLDDPVWLARFEPGTLGAAYRDPARPAASRPKDWPTRPARSLHWSTPSTP